MSLRFIQPEIVRLPLSDGEWIEVRKELTAGEYRQMLAAQIREYDDSGRPKLDPEKVGYTKVLAYLLNWSATVKFSADAINALHPDDYQEIRQAIDIHEAAVEAAYAKNTTGGETTSAATSPSVAP